MLVPVSILEDILRDIMNNPYVRKMTRIMEGCDQIVKHILEIIEKL